MKIEREKHYHNIKEIMFNCNATPIHGHTDSGYSCCFCNEHYPEPADLKRHTLETHAPDYDMKTATFMRKKNAINAYYIKLDITNLKCNLCDDHIANLDTLIQHLKKTHKRKIYTDINGRILPFKFQDGIDLTCFLCSNVFVKFKALLEHMNVHYRNFICEICDAGFVTRTMAVAHTNKHKTGSFKCSYCTRVFDTMLKKTNHERCTHTHVDIQNKCRICNEKFKYYHQKLKHLSDVHGVGCRAKCQACDRVFATQRKLRVHIRKDHLMERRNACPYCDKTFFASSELNDHVVTHTGLKKFTCDVCLKPYGRKKSLMVHKRVHANER